MQFYQRLSNLMAEKGVTAYMMGKETGISNRLIMYWKKGEKLPSSENLQKISEYFGVSVDYLLGNSESKIMNTDPLSELKGVYLSFAKDAQDSGIDPEDIRTALELLKRMKEKNRGS